MIVWAVEYCDSVYESAPCLVSLHTRAVNAFNEMRGLRQDKVEWETWEALHLMGYFQMGEYSQPKAHSKGDKNDWFYRIRKVEVSDNEQKAVRDGVELHPLNDRKSGSQLLRR